MSPQVKKKLSNSGSKKLSNAGTNEKRLAAIRKTAEEMAEPSGTSVQLLVGQAIDVYWAAREEADEGQKGSASFSFVDETIDLARLAARRMVSPVRSFFSDLFSTLAPAGITFAVLWVLAPLLALSGKSLPANWVPLVTIIIPIVLAAGTLTVLVYRKVPALVHSLGAIAGGAILAAGLMGYSAVQQVSRQAITEELAQDKLEELAISSMEKRYFEGGFLQTSTSLKPLEASVAHLKFQTRSNLQQRAVYEVAAKGLDGQMVAEVTPTDGSLYYVANNSSQLRSMFFFGQVRDVSDTSFTLTSDASTELKKFSRSLLLSKPSVGDHVIIAVDAKTSAVSRLVTLSSRYARVETSIDP